MTTTAPSTSADSPDRDRPGHTTHHAAVTDRAVPSRVTAALISYLEAVATALNRKGVAVAGVATTTTELGMVSGRIQLGRQHTRNHDHRGAVQLRWAETTGWEVSLQPTPDDAVAPWRFLHADLTPEPSHVASFTKALLRGEDLGLRYPVYFRTAGNDLTQLAKQLAHAARKTLEG